MSYQRDDDGDNDISDITDRVNSDSSHSAYSLFFPTGNPVVGVIDFAVPAQSPVQTVSPAASVISFLPLLSASGLGDSSTSSLVSIPSASSIAENAPAYREPGPGKDEMRPMPATPEAPPSGLPPLVEETPDTPPSALGGPLAELLQIDVVAIQRGVDAFFQQLTELSEEWRGGRVLEKLAPWLLAASIAGYGWIHLRDRRRSSAQARRIWDACLSGGLTDAALFLPGGER